MKVLFVCHGNICRSVMAEYILKDLDKDNKFYVESAATSTEEIGNDIYPPVKAVLDKNNIIYDKHRARQVTKDDYYKYDVIICMDKENLYNLEYILPSNDKTRLLTNYEIDDPWYTRNFDKCFEDIKQGVINFINEINIYK